MLRLVALTETMIIIIIRICCNCKIKISGLVYSHKNITFSSVYPFSIFGIFLGTVHNYVRTLSESWKWGKNWNKKGGQECTTTKAKCIIGGEGKGELACGNREERNVWWKNFRKIKYGKNHNGQQINVTLEKVICHTSTHTLLRLTVYRLPYTTCLLGWGELSPKTRIIINVVVNYCRVDKARKKCFVSSLVWSEFFLYF